MNPGRLLAGRYELRRSVGHGGMGQVWVGHDQLLDREVAVKVLDLRAGTDPAAGERFRREAQAAAALSHPSVVAVHDAGIDDGSAYLVMELLPGPSLDQVIRDRGPLPVDEALDLARQAAAGLAAVHAAGIIHRDVKPGNLMLDSAGRVKVVDFGIARLAEVTATQVTATGTVVGSPSYLSPEQARGDAATPASDHYALGCTLMVMLTGRPPFEAEQPVAMLRQHLDEAPPRVSERRPGVPAGVDSMVDDLLAKDPARRSRGIAALTGQAAGDTAVLTAPFGAVAPARQAPARLAPARLGRRTTPWLAAAAALGVLALIAVLVALAAGDDPGPAPAADPTSQAPRVQEEQPQPQPQDGEEGEEPEESEEAPPPTDLAGALDALDAAIRETVASGGTDEKTAKELGDKVDELRKESGEGKGPEDLAKKLDDLVEKMEKAQEKGELTDPGAIRAAIEDVRATI